MNAQAYDLYKNATVETVSPEKLLLMLYEGAIRFIDNAQQGIAAKDINLAHQQNIKAQNIILELMATLKMDYEISHSLYALYEYMYLQLVQANVKKDTAILEEVKGFLKELRDTWAEAIKSLKTPGAKTANTEIKAVNIPVPAPVNNKVPTRSNLDLQG